MPDIAPTARVHPRAIVGEGTSIGDFAIVDEDVVIGARCKIEPYVWIKRWTTLGDDNEISAHTVLGTDPLDKNFKGERSYLRIGHRNRIREHYTISRGTKPEAETTIGDDNYIMTGGHIAHDCRIGHGTVICSCALIAGYVSIEDRSFISGGVVVHQYSKIGALTMVGGNSRVNLDLAPYFLYHGFDAAPVGLNAVGLRRAGMPFEHVAELKSAYRILFREGRKLDDACAEIERTAQHDPARHVIKFIRESHRGIARP
ncbi:MAG: acyl-ACP--UDP-N-acetylglucosamine O-acyltransferase [Bryobacteraceae bacterium]|nr:acyl-ACP--UDP-N-acetylglucosamine O-acyltransferase [Bryobacteraceae bacterium]